MSALRFVIAPLCAIGLAVAWGCSGTSFNGASGAAQPPAPKPATAPAPSPAKVETSQTVPSPQSVPGATTDPNATTPSGITPPATIPNQSDVPDDPLVPSTTQQTTFDEPTCRNRLDQGITDPSTGQTYRAIGKGTMCQTISVCSQWGGQPVFQGLVMPDEVIACQRWLDFWAQDFPGDFQEFCSGNFGFGLGVPVDVIDHNTDPNSTFDILCVR